MMSAATAVAIATAPGTVEITVAVTTSLAMTLAITITIEFHKVSWHAMLRDLSHPGECYGKMSKRLAQKGGRRSPSSSELHNDPSKQMLQHGRRRASLHQASGRFEMLVFVALI